ncbi:MAG: hypothetical protein IH978_08055 [Nitrospinae bacterium]|nr:hypothetical protein [Nitrospinota bacterium]
MSEFQPILTRHLGQPGSATLDYYQIHESYQGARRAILEMTSDEVIQVVKDSGLQGRGGAGFPTGVKWSFIPKDSRKPKYLINNADESEPGTFKDRLLINHNPHQVIEGMIIDKGINSRLSSRKIGGVLLYYQERVGSEPPS